MLCTPPPHTSSSEEILPRLTRRTLAQLRTNKSPFLKSYLHKVDAKTHPSPLCPLCNIHTHDTHHLFNCTHIRTTLSPPDLWTDPAGVTALLARWTEKLAGGPTTSGNIGLPPLARVMGVGRKKNIEGKMMLSTRYCHCKINGHLKDIRNTTMENTCCIFPNFLHSIKIKHFIYFTCIRFEGIIFAIKVVYDLEDMVQIDTACARVYKLDLTSSSQQWGPHFLFVWQAGHAQPLK